MQDKLAGASKVMMGVGAAGLGAAAGLELLIENNRKFNASLDKSAITMRVDRNELRRLALDMADASTSTDEVTAAFDELSRAGINNMGDMERAARSFTKLGDATGVSADALVRGLTPAFKAFRIPVADAEGQLDTFTYLLKNTNYNFDDMSNALEKVSPRMADAGFKITDAAAALKILSDKGIDGKVAISEIDKAIDAYNESSGTADEKTRAFWDALGADEGLLTTTNKNMSDLAGSTDDYAEAANKAITPTQNLKSDMDKLALTLGEQIDPFSSMITLGGSLSGAMLTAAIGVQALSSAYTILAANPALAAVTAALIVMAAGGYASSRADATLTDPLYDDTGGGSWNGAFTSDGSGGPKNKWDPVNGWTPVNQPTNYGLNLGGEPRSSVDTSPTVPALDLGRINSPPKDFVHVPGGRVPMMAEGGIVSRPTLAIIGEKGPEAIVPLRGGGIGGNIEVYMILDGRTIGKAVAPYTASEMKQRIIVKTGAR